jgi:hypothetical protein
MKQLLKTKTVSLKITIPVVHQLGNPLSGP